MGEKTMRKLAKPMLFLAAFIWGSSFFIMKDALDQLPVQYLLAIRFTAGAALLGLLCWKKWRTFTPDYLWRGAVIGGMLYTAYAIQTYGLALTTPSKNAFLTAVYCVLVPFLYWAFARVKPDRYNVLAALLCVTGVGLVSLTGDLTVNPGDGLTLLCAIFYAMHIVSVAKVSPGKDIYLLTVFQFAFAGLYAWIGGVLPRPGADEAGGPAAPGLSGGDGHHGGAAVPERGPGVVRPGVGVGDSVAGIGIRRTVLGAVCRRSGKRPDAGGICADFRGGGLQRDEVFLFAEKFMKS